MDSTAFAPWDINLAISKPGNIYALVRDPIHPKVLEFSPDGKKLLAKFGDGGDAPGKFNSPNDIGVDDRDRVYIAEFARVQMLDSQGRYLTNLVESRSLGATGLLYDGKGMMYVLRYNAIYKYRVGDTPAE